jgi:hypothetical protein
MRRAEVDRQFEDIAPSHAQTNKLVQPVLLVVCGGRATSPRAPHAAEAELQTGGAPHTQGRSEERVRIWSGSGSKTDPKLKVISTMIWQTFI